MSNEFKMRVERVLELKDISRVEAGWRVLKALQLKNARKPVVRQELTNEDLKLLGVIN